MDKLRLLEIIADAIICIFVGVKSGHVSYGCACFSALIYLARIDMKL